jgi:hypothetical protein
VTAGLTLPHSSGAVEGTVNKIKFLKRQMFGRRDAVATGRRDDGTTDTVSRDDRTGVPRPAAVFLRTPRPINTGRTSAEGGGRRVRVALCGYGQRMSNRDELRQIEADLERLRTEVAALRDQVGEIGATDAVERAQMINMADEQQVLITVLEGRREALMKSSGGE